MTLIVFIAGLASAVLHAFWNALTRGRRDPGAVLMGVTVVNGAACVPAVLVLGAPPMAAWPYVAAGGFLNLLTMRALMETYRRTPFALAYPLVRGVAPLFVTLMGWLVLGDQLSALGVAGVAAISAAVLMLAASARGGRVDRTGLLLALFSGLTNAGFVMSDAGGVRITGDPFVYGCTQTVVSGLTLGSLSYFEGRSPFAVLRVEPVVVPFCAALAMASYLLVLYGLSNGPAGAVSALRETSIFIGVLLAAFMLKERVGPLRWAAAIVAVGGVVMIRLG